MKIDIKNCDVREKVNGCENDSIEFDITVEGKTIRCLEWFDGCSVERTDSHLRINESDELADLFGVTRHDLIPFTDVYDELDDCLDWHFEPYPGDEHFNPDEVNYPEC
jgi:hypothetical protein|tara:strand:+ start:96 stop:419 length:324 start_codon:yes stop_codon:yes gene_type:complete